MCFIKIGSVVRSTTTGNVGVVFDILVDKDPQFPLYNCIGFNNNSFVSSSVDYVSESLSKYINENVRYVS